MLLPIFCKHIRHEGVTAETSGSQVLLKQDKHDGLYLFLNTLGTRAALLGVCSRLSCLSHTDPAQELPFPCLLGKEMLQRLKQRLSLMLRAGL